MSSPKSSPTAPDRVPGPGRRRGGPHRRRIAPETIQGRVPSGPATRDPDHEAFVDWFVPDRRHHGASSWPRTPARRETMPRRPSGKARGRLHPRVDRGAGPRLLPRRTAPGNRAVRRRARPDPRRGVPGLRDRPRRRQAPRVPAADRGRDGAPFDCVLVFHTSRFARNTVEAKRYKKLLRYELGIDVISVTQPLGADADDPAAFLSESVHEIFDEYYSVSLSFWTKMGLREKARQGQLTGSLPWGYAKGEDEIAEPDPTSAIRARLFERYATGQHTDRTLAEWLNVNERRTTRDRAFGADTVREMLCNAAYCGYVSARRDKTKTIQGLHEAIVDEALFDRVQETAPPRARNAQARPALPALPAARPRTLRALPGQDARHRRRAQARGALLLRHAPRQAHLRPAAHPRPARRGAARRVRRRLQARADDLEEILHRLARGRNRRHGGPPSAAPPSKSAYAALATSTSSATSPAPSTSPAATRSTPSSPRSHPRPLPDLDQAQRVPRRLLDLLAPRDRPRRQAPAPRAHLRARLARQATRRRRPAKTPIRALLRGPEPRNPCKSDV